MWGSIYEFKNSKNGLLDNNEKGLLMNMKMMNKKQEK